MFNLAGPKAAYILYVIVFGTISRYGGGEPFFMIIVLYNTFLQFWSIFANIYIEEKYKGDWINVM